MINIPNRLFATKAEIEAAKSGNSPELARKYIEHLEEIAEASLEVQSWDYDDVNAIDWDPLRNALGKVYAV